MKIWMFVVISLMLGVAGGICAAVYQLGWPRSITAMDMAGRRLSPEGVEDDFLVLPEDRAGDPKFALADDTFDFGQISVGEEMSHEFPITNEGVYPLRLRVLGSSCQCAVADLPQDEIPPQATANVTLTWRAEVGASGAFRHWATLGTNDPARGRVTLTVNGSVRESVKVAPAASVVSIGPNQPATVQFRVLAEGFAFRLLNISAEDSEHADAFRVEHHPLTKDETSGLNISGYLVTVQVLPKFPLGKFTQDLVITTDEPGRAEPLKHHIGVQVVGDISIGGGKGWNAEQDLMSFGTVRRQDGAKTTLYFLLRGPHRDKLAFRLKSSVPQGMLVTPGEARPVDPDKGDVWRMPVEISVPKGLAPINLLPKDNHSDDEELGELILETGHPEEEEFRMRVSLSVVE